MTYSTSEALVSTDWVAEHGASTGVRLVEVDVDTYSYDEGHIKGAISWSWTHDLCDGLVRDVASPQQMEALLERSGIGRETQVIVYGDNNNWFAAHAFWLLKLYGHPDVRLMDGGRRKWIDEGREVTREIPKPAPRPGYKTLPADVSLRALLPEVQAAVSQQATDLVDVRSPAEFRGEILAPPGLPELCLRGGHLPGAVNVPWSDACNEDGTFKDAEALRSLYEAHGVTGERPIIAYCRIGERSSHTWFALKYLLGLEHVKNYDGSWTEWGNLVRAPIER